jgi:hypothetical protein
VDAGVTVAIPSAYYPAAIAAGLTSGIGTGGQIGGPLVFNFVAFAVAEISLREIPSGAEATHARLDQFQQWVTAISGSS